MESTTSNAPVGARELAALLDEAANSGAPVRVLDVRWSLGVPAELPLYEAGHMPVVDAYV